MKLENIFDRTFRVYNKLRVVEKYVIISEEFTLSEPFYILEIQDVAYEIFKPLNRIVKQLSLMKMIPLKLSLQLIDPEKNKIRISIKAAQPDWIIGDFTFKEYQKYLSEVLEGEK